MMKFMKERPKLHDYHNCRSCRFSHNFRLKFTIKKILNSNLASLLAANKRCPISYRDLEVLYFMPGVEMIDVTIPSSCSTSIKNDIAIKFIEIRFRGFDFAVFGPKASIETNLGKSLISTNVAVGTTEVNLTDIDSRLNLQDLNRFLRFPSIYPVILILLVNSIWKDE